MSLKHIDEYHDSDIAKSLIQKIKSTSNRDIRLLGVCGTHTVSIFRSGIRSVLPATISLLSGPGCPVCVTDQKEIDAFIELAKIDDVIITTLGDLNGKDAAVIGEVIEDPSGKVIMETCIGGMRIVDMLVGEQLPRIC